jgi:hypothetical protein
VRLVSIRGGGIAACCCSRLLRRAGFRVAEDKLDRPKLPAVMLSETSQKLLQDLFQQNKLLAGVHRIRRRAVLWGEQAEAVMLPHSALVVSEATLLNRIQAEAVPGGGAEQDVAEWEILAARTHPSAASRPFLEHAFGTRMASALPVMLKADVASDACWIESQPEGWLFLLPSDERSGWLLAVGVQPERILAGSRLIAAQITATGSEAGSFASYPRIAEPLWGWRGTCGAGSHPGLGRDLRGFSRRRCEKPRGPLRGAPRGRLPKAPGSLPAILRGWPLRAVVGPTDRRSQPRIGVVLTATCQESRVSIPP